MKVLEYTSRTEASWIPPEITEEVLENCRNEAENSEYAQTGYLSIFKTEPYIDSLYFKLSDTGKPDQALAKRFLFCDGYVWSFNDEAFFVDNCLKDLGCGYTTNAIDSIYKYYSDRYPDWKLKRYYTAAMRLLDHIYHCMRKGSAKEMLYKAELDMLAVNIGSLDEINLLSTKPSDIYDGISMRTLRSLNCSEGSHLLETSQKRAFVKGLQARFPDIFNEKLNDAQCGYLNYLIEGDLTVGEVGRLFKARRLDLMTIWAPAQYKLFIWKVKKGKQMAQDAKALGKIDPIYQSYISKLKDSSIEECQRIVGILREYLLINRETYDKDFRRCVRRHIPDWQERNHGYVVRYPQTINDFCRESAYMSNCLLTYVDAVLCNDTTILFMRKMDSVNDPFITIEIFDGELRQAYHRFNEDCSFEEAEWIRKYCKRHGIGTSKFEFNIDVDWDNL
jgi:hypothetical protein